MVKVVHDEAEPDEASGSVLVVHIRWSKEWGPLTRTRAVSSYARRRARRDSSVRNSRRPRLRLAILLSIAGLLCWTIGSFGYADPWGNFVAGAGDSMPWTILVLLLASRRVEDPRSTSGPPTRLGRIATVPSWIILLGCLVSMAGGALAPTEFGPITMAGAVTGTILAVLVWAEVDPLRTLELNHTNRLNHSRVRRSI